MILILISLQKCPDKTRIINKKDTVELMKRSSLSSFTENIGKNKYKIQKAANTLRKQPAPKLSEIYKDINRPEFLLALFDDNGNEDRKKHIDEQINNIIKNSNFPSKDGLDPVHKITIDLFFNYLRLESLLRSNSSDHNKVEELKDIIKKYKKILGTFSLYKKEDAEKFLNNFNSKLKALGKEAHEKGIVQLFSIIGMDKLIEEIKGES